MSIPIRPQDKIFSASITVEWNPDGTTTFTLRQMVKPANSGVWSATGVQQQYRTTEPHNLAFETSDDHTATRITIGGVGIDLTEWVTTNGAMMTSVESVVRIR